MTFIKRMLGLCGLSATLAMASGCSDYTYFNVTVYLNNQDDNIIDGRIMSEARSCLLTVSAGGKQIENSVELSDGNTGAAVCRKGLDGTKDKIDNINVLKLGVLDYSTARDSGELEFTVTVLKPAGDAKEITAQGSATARVSSGKVLEVPLVIDACSTSEHPKGKSCEGSN